MHGSVIVRLSRRQQDVLVEVIDDGVGLPEGFSLDQAKGLGLSIVQALVTGELAGTIEIPPRRARGSSSGSPWRRPPPPSVVEPPTSSGLRI